MACVMQYRILIDIYSYSLFTVLISSIDVWKRSSETQRPMAPSSDRLWLLSKSSRYQATEIVYHGEPRWDQAVWLPP